MPLFKYACILLASVLLSCRNSHYRSHNKFDISDDGNPEEDESNNDCGIEDGTHSATVDYYNPSTGYSKTYDLDVEVENCQVIQIDFSNGGYLDDTHINAADIDESGDASVEDDRGRTFDIHIDD